MIALNKVVRFIHFTYFCFWVVLTQHQLDVNIRIYVAVMVTSEFFITYGKDEFEM